MIVSLLASLDKMMLLNVPHGSTNTTESGGMIVLRSTTRLGERLQAGRGTPEQEEVGHAVQDNPGGSVVGGAQAGAG